MSRDGCGRLRRNSRLVSKLAKWLRGQLAIFAVFRNYVRRRFEKEKPQEALRWSDLNDVHADMVTISGLLSSPPTARASVNVVMGGPSSIARRHLQLHVV